MNEIVIAEKKFKKGDIVKLTDDCKKFSWYWNVDYEVYDYAYMQMTEVYSGNLCDVLEKTYYSGDSFYEFESFEGWIVLLRSVGREKMEIDIRTVHESFIELSTKDINRHQKINSILSEV